MEKERSKRFKRIAAILDRAIQINEFDYKYVMNNLRKSEEQEARKKERVKKFRKNNIKWKNKLELVKQAKEEQYKDNQEKIMLQLHTKLSRKSNDNSRDESFVSNSNSSRNEEEAKQARVNIEKCRQKDEEQRLKLQESINTKLERISKKNEFIKLRVKNKFHQKFESYKTNLIRLKELEEEKLNKFRQLEMEKSERFRIYNDYLRGQKRKQQVIKQKEQQKMEEIDEKMKSMKELQDEKRKELEDKLVLERKKINKYNFIRMNSLEKKVNNGLKRFNENSKVLNSNRDSNNKAILKKERNTVRKSLIIDHSFDLSRSNQQEQTMITQIEVERMVTDIAAKLKVLRGFSIYKKPEEERKNLYREIKLMEEEQRRKEHDEAKMKQDQN